MVVGRFCCCFMFVCLFVCFVVGLFWFGFFVLLCVFFIWRGAWLVFFLEKSFWSALG